MYRRIGGASRVGTGRAANLTFSPATVSPMRKRVVRSPLDLLPLAAKQVLVGWLTSGGRDGVGISYVEAADRLRREFGVKTNPASLVQWRKRNLRAVGIVSDRSNHAKPVVRSPLDRLPREVRETLFAWLSTGGADGRGVTYAQAAARLRSDFGLIFGTTAIHNFYQRFQRAHAPAVARITTTDSGDMKIITLETAAAAAVETIQDAKGATLILKITLPKS